MNTYSRLLLAFFSLSFSQFCFCAEPQLDLGINNKIIRCEDKTPDIFAEQSPKERMVVVSFLFSSVVKTGDTDRVSHIMLYCKSPKGGFTVEDQLPKTELMDLTVGPVQITVKTSKQKSKKSGGSSSVEVSVPALIRFAKGDPGEISATQDGEELTVDFDRPIPKGVQITSGVQDGGRKVYWKIVNTEQIPIDNQQRFIFLVRVPDNWRGDLLKLTAEARTKDGKICGELNQDVGLYLSGDTEAERLIKALFQAQRQYDSLRAELENYFATDKFRRPVMRRHLGWMRSFGFPYGFLTRPPGADEKWYEMLTEARAKEESNRPDYMKAKQNLENARVAVEELAN